MKIHPRDAARTYRLVDERSEVSVRGPLSLLMPGTHGGHLLLALPDSGREDAPRVLALGLAASRGPAEAWRVLAASGAGEAAAPRRVFCFAFATDDLSLVFYTQADDDQPERLED